MKRESHTADELALSYGRIPSQGMPLLYLHGVTRGLHDYVSLVPVFTPQWDVYALDFRGHGDSGRVHEDRYRVINYVQDAVTLVRDVIGRPTVIYGHSLGAMVAAAAAAELPDLVHGIVMEDPPFDTMGKRIAGTPFLTHFKAMREWAASDLSVAEITRQFQDMRLPTMDMQDTVRVGDVRDAASLRFSAKCLAKLDHNVLTPIVEGRWLEGYNVNSIMPQVRCPAMLLQADYDCGGMLPDEDARKVAAMIPDCIHIKVPNVGHLIHWMERDVTLRHTLNFTGSL